MSLPPSLTIFDTFLFYNELEMLKVRLEYLGETVDRFVICEANIDFSGAKKDYVLNEKIIKSLPYSNKIIYHREEINLSKLTWQIKKWFFKYRPSKYLWKIQHAQRNAILKSLIKFPSETYIVFGDLDEIPNKDSLKNIRQLNFSATESYTLEQESFYYSTNHQHIQKWRGTILTTLNNFRKIKPAKLRKLREKLPYIVNGGWHFSYFMTPDKIKQKIQAIAEVERQNSNFSDQEIQEKIANRNDLFNRNVLFQEEGSPNTIPKELNELLRKHLPNCVSL